ncbi:MAG: hypothetical protein JXQ71_01950 [Verrucomicrobia bacterium]|nr:hypothetical protein [Verrucomicrobiota bacterium]
MNLSLLGSLLLVPLLAAPAVAQISTFDTDNDGWTVINNGESPLSWLATGGNPGGCIQNQDASAESGWFEAPAKFLGNQSAVYGIYLRFDLRTQSPFAVPAGQLVELVGGAGQVSLRFPMPTLPSRKWTSITIPLVASAGWLVNEIYPATEEQLQTVLADLQHLRIDADIIDGVDQDVTSLDNVTFTSCLPPTVSIRVSHFEVCWNSCTNKTYNVQYSTVLAPDTWINLSTGLPGNGTTNCVLDSIPVGAPWRFYRVQPVE